MLYTLEVEVSEVLKHIGNVSLIVCLYVFVYKSMTLKFFQAQVTCATFFYFDTCPEIFGNVLKFF